MGKTRNFAAIIILLLVSSSTCNAFTVRKLIASNGPTTSQQGSPIGSPVNDPNTKKVDAEKPPIEKPKESPVTNQNNNKTSSSPTESKSSKVKDNDDKNSGAPNVPVEKNVDKASPTKLDNLNSCEGSLNSCSDKDMVACIEPSKHSGTKEVFLLLQNNGESTLKINVNLPNTLENAFSPLEVPKHETRRMNISSIMDKSTELTVNSGDAKCVLHLVNPVSADNIIQQLTFYSKQVTPIYAVYASFILALLLGGTWACCKLRKRNSRQPDGIPYQELEMGLPVSASAVNVDAAAGWDDDWDDDDDWDEGNAVKSPSGNGVRNVSADGLTSRPSKKNGWEDNWDD